MSTEYKLTDEQWCLLDLLMRSRSKGVHRLNRHELLSSATLPQLAAIRLMWGALVMPAELIEWHSKHDFSITAAGVSLYNLRFGKAGVPPTPMHVADAVICLPDHSQGRH